MDAFWCITLSILLIRWVWKRNRKRRFEDEQTEIPEQDFGPIITKELIEADNAERARQKEQKQRDKDIAALKKQGYTDEIIAVILPTINNDGK